MDQPRTSAEIVQIIETAKLHPKDLNPVVQEIHFHQNFGGSECKLLELDPEVEKYLSVGSCLVIRGLEDDSAVMCTENSTFELKDAEISNSLLLMESLYFPEQTKEFIPQPVADLMECQVDGAESLYPERIMKTQEIVGIAHNYIEMRRVKPNLGKVVHLLEPTSYRGNDGEHQLDSSQLKTMDDLLNEVSASDSEIKAYLQSLKYVEILGFVRLVECDYLFRVLNLVLDMVEENSWNNKSIIKSAVIAQLRTLEPNFILEKVFEWFFVRIQPTASLDEDEDNLTIDEELYGMQEDSICILFGEVILKKGGKFNLREFVKTWQDSVPKGLKVSLRQLQDICIVDEASSPPTIRYFPEFNLPTNTQDRLNVLFGAKPKWKHDEIMPFMSTLATSEQNASILLTKFCRVTSPEGVKTYCAKYR